MMKTGRMAYYAEKYLQLKIAYWEGIVEREPENEMAEAILENYRQELHDLNDKNNCGNLTEEGHW